MAEKDHDGPSLELPSLSLGRKRKKRRDRPESEQPAPVPEAETAPPAAPVPEPEPAPAPEPEPTRTEVMAPAAREETPVSGRPLFTDEVPTDSPAPEPTEAAATGRGFSLPALGGIPASLLSGLVAGVLTVGLIWASLRLCEVVRGTSSCGNAGFPLLLAALVIAAVAGAAMLRAFGVDDAGSTSALGMGLVAVAMLLFLGDQLFAWWIVIAVPLVAMATYALAHGVTTAFVEPVEDNMHR